VELQLPEGWIGWDNSPIVLFHGTLLSSVASIVSNVDITRGEADTDFGRGFYTSTLLSQAIDWAERKAITAPILEEPAVVRLKVNRLALSRLTHLGFVRGARDAEDFWRFVFHCRQERPHILQSESYYDVVYGPVAEVWDDPPHRSVFPHFDQISFHTSESQVLLNNGLYCEKEIIDDWR